MIRSARAAIIGAGISGSACVKPLRDAGFVVTVYEKGEIAAGASGNPYAMVTPYFPRQKEEGAYGSLLRQALDCWKERISDFSECKCEGAVFLDRGKETERLAVSGRERLSSSAVSEILGIDVSHEGYWVPEVWSLQLKTLCMQELQGAVVKRYAKVCDLRQDGSGWKILTEEGERTYDMVVIANAWEARALDLTRWLPLEPVRGQLCWGVGKGLPKKTVIFGNYLIPFGEEGFVLGAAYAHKDLSPDAREKDTQQLVEKFEQVFPSSIIAVEGARTSFRASTHDKLPYIGAVERFDSSLSEEERSPLKNLYAVLGMGSRGALLSSLAARCLQRFLLNIEDDCAAPVAPKRARGTALRRMAKEATTLMRS